jgi:hypothetical protein
MPSLLQGLLVGALFLLIAFVALSWSQKPIAPAWTGEDAGTRFIYCALGRRADEHDSGPYIRLTRIPALGGALTTITFSGLPRPSVQVHVYAGRSFVSTIQSDRRRWLSESEYDQLLQDIADTGVLQRMPSTESALHDGIWFGIEYSWEGGRLAYGSNDPRVIGTVVHGMYEHCGAICREADELADSIEVFDDSESWSEECVRYLRARDTRAYL